MRYEKRIYRLCDHMSYVWSKCFPDMRFGQFVELLFHDIKKDGIDPFYLEDDDIIKYITRYLNK